MYTWLRSQIYLFWAVLRVLTRMLLAFFFYIWQTADSPATSDDTKAVGFTSTAEGVASVSGRREMFWYGET